MLLFSFSKYKNLPHKLSTGEDTRHEYSNPLYDHADLDAGISHFPVYETVSNSNSNKFENPMFDIIQNTIYDRADLT